MTKLTAAEKQRLEDLHDVTQVLRVAITSLLHLNPPAMPSVARALRDATANDGLSAVARVLIWDLADGIDAVTRVDTEHSPR